MANELTSSEIAEIEENVVAAPTSKVEAIVFLSLFGGVIALVAAGIIADEKRRREQQAEWDREMAERKRKKDELAEWINSEENAGKRIFKLADGRHLSVPLDAGAKTVIHS